MKFVDLRVFHFYRVNKLSLQQFAPGSSSKVLITSADSRLRVIDGIDLVHKLKGTSFGLSYHGHTMQ
jgi:hypothetical protein